SAPETTQSLFITVFKIEHVRVGGCLHWSLNLFLRFRVGMYDVSSPYWPKVAFLLSGLSGPVFSYTFFIYIKTSIQHWSAQFTEQ
ncbi:MAG TPA: hypothetical protein VFM05_11920, partial [Candidatus Saccharimonadales bacterium]|nr:hypothetical protein [Candidatus Saccharimonadales bacterium]